MTTTLLENITTYEEKALSTLKDVQGTVLEYARKASDVVAPRVPENLPSLSAEIKPTDLVTNVFDFAVKAIEANKGFVVELLTIVHDTLDKPSTKPATKPSTKPATKTATKTAAA